MLFWVSAHTMSTRHGTAWFSSLGMGFARQQNGPVDPLRVATRSI
jgi:hypothetical protein